MTAPCRARPNAHRPLPFLGREREIERLDEAWSRAKMQRGGIVFVGGEPGIGKSRLVREFMARGRRIRRPRARTEPPVSPRLFRISVWSTRCASSFRSLRLLDIGADVVCGLDERAAGVGATRWAAAGAADHPRRRSAARLFDALRTRARCDWRGRGRCSSCSKICIGRARRRSTRSAFLCTSPAREFCFS